MSRASAALTAATALTSGDQAMAGMLQSIGDQLHQYIELNATASANNLQGFPVGLRYLHQASTLMQATSCRWPQKFSQAATDDLARAQDTAKGTFLDLFLALGRSCCCAAVTQAREARRTRRLFNPGLLAATGALPGDCAWLLSATVPARRPGGQGPPRARPRSPRWAPRGSPPSRPAPTRCSVLVGRGVNDAYMDAYKTATRP